MKHLINILFCTISWVAITTSCGNSSKNMPYFRIQENGLYGFIDTMGNVVIPPSYKYVSGFTKEGYACVVSAVEMKDSVINVRYGYINKNNDIVVDTTQILTLSLDELSTFWKVSPEFFFNSIERFNTGELDFRFVWFNELIPNRNLYVFQDKTSKLLGYKHLDGNIVILPSFKYASNMQYGVAFVNSGFEEDETEELMKSVSNNLNMYSLINSKGEYIKQKAWAVIAPFDKNRKTWCAEIALKEQDDDISIVLSWMQIDVTGKIIIGPVAGSLGSVVYNGYKDNSELYIYRFPGMLGMNPVYSFINKDGKYATDLDGDNMIITWGENAEVFQDVTNFSEGVAGALVFMEDDENPRWAFMNPDFEIVHNEVYDSIIPFSNGLAAVEGKSMSFKHSGDWGFVNHDFELVIPYKFSDVGSFHSGLAYATIHGSIFSREGYINKLGEFVWETQRRE